MIYTCNSTFMFSSNWQELALYICQNRHSLKATDLHTMNQRLKGALEMHSMQSINNGMQNVGNAMAVSTFIKTYRN